MPGKSGRGQVHAILAEIFQLPTNGNKHVRINTPTGQVCEKMNGVQAAMNSFGRMVYAKVNVLFREISVQLVCSLLSKVRSLVDPFFWMLGPIVKLALDDETEFYLLAPCHERFHRTAVK